MSSERESLQRVRAGADVFADAQPAIKKIVMKRGIELVFNLLMSLIDRIEKLEGNKK